MSKAMTQQKVVTSRRWTACASIALTTTATALGLTTAAPATARAADVLFSFKATTSSGDNPDGTLLRDASGALYGATWFGGYIGGLYSYYGTLFKLSPPAPGRTRWKFSRLYSFSGDPDGSNPNSSLVMDASGSLYGTTFTGGDPTIDQGLVFKLTPPAPETTKWTLHVLHAFHYSFVYKLDDGSSPQAGVIMDKNGALYGTTVFGGSTADPSAVGYGTVYKLTPPAPGQTSWTETVLYRFAASNDGAHPSAELALDDNGNLYGTTSDGGSGSCLDAKGFNVTGCGTAFKLASPAPGQTQWTKKTLYRFTGRTDGGRPKGKLLLDKSGALYGTTFQGGTGTCTDVYSHVIQCGVAYKLNPPAPGYTNWTQSVLHRFNGGSDGAAPQGGLIADSAGHLYGTASGGGTHGDGLAFMLSPPAPGQTKWTETVLDGFYTLNDGDTPVGELVRDDAGDLFGVNYNGGPDNGSVFEIKP
jgi:uncharacterized repeat protein (TIGR03803 family)